MSTKSNRSSGTQHNQRGVTQGNTLVDPVTGLPVAVITDSNGVKRLAVDANFVAQNVQANVNLDSDEDEVAVEDPDTGAHIRVELDGSINANVEIDAADGDNVLSVGTEDGTISGTRHVQKIGPEGDLRVKDTEAIAELQDIESDIENTNSILQSEFDATQALIQSESDQTQTILQTEFDETQVKLDTINTTIQTESDQTQTILQTEFDQTQTLMQTEFDQTQVKLDEVKTEIDSSQYTMNEAFDKATAIAGQLDDAGTIPATENNIAPVRITPQRAIHSNLRNATGGELLTRQERSNSIPVVEAIEPASFILHASAIAIASNKSMLALMNGVGSGVVIKILKVKIMNTQTSSVVGIIADFRLRRLTALTGGTSVVPRSHDTNDAINGSITSATGGTPTDLTGPVDLGRYVYSTDEWGPGTADVESMDHSMQTVWAIYQHMRGEKPITIRPGEGLDVRQLTASTAGTFDIQIIFTQE
jgi:hypothetical protein